MAEEAVVEVPEESSTPETQVEETDEQVGKTEEATNSDDADDTGEPKRQDKGVGKRINELTREKYEARREAELLREQLARLQQQPQQAQSQAAPTPDQFQTYEDYQRALVRHELRQELEADRRNKEMEEYAKRTQEVQKTWKERESAARNEIADFDEVVYSLLEYPAVASNQVLADALADSPIGAKVLYELGKDHNEALRIASLSPAACAREIGKIEARLEAQSAKKSSAPPPPKPVTGGAKATTGLRDDLPIEEWVRRRNAELRKR